MAALSPKKILTIPNLISVIRILMIPFIIWAFLENQMIVVLILVALSGISDKIDGTIARKMNQVSDIGKMLDPVADKLTQVVLSVLMFVQFRSSADPWMQAFAWVFLLFIAKEVVMMLFALFMLIIGKRPGAAEVWGKAATVVFYVVMVLLFLAGPEIGVFSETFTLPQLAVQIMVILSVILTFVAFFSYFPSTYRILFNKESKKDNDKAA